MLDVTLTPEAGVVAVVTAVLDVCFAQFGEVLVEEIVVGCLVVDLSLVDQCLVGGVPQILLFQALVHFSDQVFVDFGAAGRCLRHRAEQRAGVSLYCDVEVHGPDLLGGVLLEYQPDRAFAAHFGVRLVFDFHPVGGRGFGIPSGIGGERHGDSEKFLLRNNEECPAPCCFTGPGILFLQLFWAAYARSTAFRAQTAAAHSARAQQPRIHLKIVFIFCFLV